MPDIVKPDAIDGEVALILYCKDHLLQRKVDCSCFALARKTRCEVVGFSHDALLLSVALLRWQSVPPYSEASSPPSCGRNFHPCDRYCRFSSPQCASSQQ